jgi:hypothetical protein
VTAVLQFHLGIHRSGLMAEWGVVVLTAVGVIHGLGAGLLVAGVVVADAAVLKFGHGMGLEGLRRVCCQTGPLRGKERCFA